MPNYCDYTMKVKGSKQAIDNLLKCLTADYNYDAGRPEHKHFFRVFDAQPVYEEPKLNQDGTYTQFIFGYCAWSVHSCMCDGGFSYYDSVKKDYPEIFMGTTLEEESKDCEIEVFSEEEGMCFSEHYIFKNGECVCDEEEEIETGGYTKTGKPTKRINFDTYEGETIVFNPFRENETGDFIFSI